MAELTRRLRLQSLILCKDDFRRWARFRDKPMTNGDVMLYYRLMQNAVSFNATDSIVPVPLSSGLALMKMWEMEACRDLVEIDADHDFFRPDGVMFGHDYFTAADSRCTEESKDRLILFLLVFTLTFKSGLRNWKASSRDIMSPNA